MYTRPGPYKKDKLSRPAFIYFLFALLLYRRSTLALYFVNMARTDKYCPRAYKYVAIRVVAESSLHRHMACVIATTIIIILITKSNSVTRRESMIGTHVFRKMVVNYGDHNTYIICSAWLRITKYQHLTMNYPAEMRVWGKLLFGNQTLLSPYWVKCLMVWRIIGSQRQKSWLRVHVKFRVWKACRLNLISTCLWFD